MDSAKRKIRGQINIQSLEGFLRCRSLFHVLILPDKKGSFLNCDKKGCQKVKDAYRDIKGNYDLVCCFLS